MWISTAYAAATPAGPSFMPMLIQIAVIGVAFYFFMIRPQQQKTKAHRALIDALKKGDEVVISGGTLGKVAKVSAQHIQVEIAEKVEIWVQRSAVVTVLPSGTIKGL